MSFAVAGERRAICFIRSNAAFVQVVFLIVSVQMVSTNRPRTPALHQTHEVPAAQRSGSAVQVSTDVHLSSDGHSGQPPRLCVELSDDSLIRCAAGVR